MLLEGLAGSGALEELNVSSCDLKEEQAASLGPALGQLRQLKKLNLSINTQLSAGGWAALLEGLACGALKSVTRVVAA